MSKGWRPRRLLAWVGRQRRWILWVLIALAWALGLVGWAQADPSLAADEIVYRTAAMFALSFSGPPSIPLTLDIARFLAASVVFWAAGAVVLQVVAHQRRVRRACRMTGHVVVLGDGPNTAALARAYGLDDSVHVALVGDAHARATDDSGPERLVRVPAVADTLLRKILRGATQVLIEEATDGATIDLARRVRAIPGYARSTLLLEDRDVATQWNAADNSWAICRSSQLALELLRRNPPFLEDAMVPPPVVIGDGKTAGEVARRIVTGWQQPGERIIVHCVGRDPDWLDAARAGIAERAEFTWTDMGPHAADGPGIVKGLVAQWRGPRAGRATVKGPRVYVAYADATVGVPMACALAASLARDALVIVLVDSADAWKHTLIGPGPVPILVSREALLSDPKVIDLDREALLASEIVADAGRWPTDVPGVLGVVRRDTVGAARLESQDGPAQAGARALAAGIEKILAAGGVAVRNGALGPEPALLLNPDELVAVADMIGEVLGPSGLLDASEEGRHRRLELAARLPNLAARAGWVTTRLPGHHDALSPDAIARLAWAAHNSYNNVALATRNATHSDNAMRGWEELSEVDQRSNVAQVLDIPVKLAMLGRDWRRADAPQHSSELRRRCRLPWCRRPPEPEQLTFSAAEIERLAEWEHRRWAHFELRNGRPDHDWNLAWADIDDGVKEYDRAPVTSIPAALASEGIEIVDAAAHAG